MSPVQEECVAVEEAVQWCSKSACETHFIVGQEAKKIYQISFLEQKRMESGFTILGGFMLVVIKGSWISCTGALTELCKALSTFSCTLLSCTQGV